MTKPIIPDKPVYWFNGKRQPAAFTEGVFAFRDFMDRAYTDSDGRFAIGDKAFAEKYAERILSELASGKHFGLGYAAALANWLAIHRHSTQPLKTWNPLYTQPLHREVNGDDYYEPGPRSLLFEVDGAAITVSEDLYCLRFGPSDCDSFDIDEVRERGKPISRERFDELRGMAEAETT
jgi:hypothetical protein